MRARLFAYLAIAALVSGACTDGSTATTSSSGTPAGSVTPTTTTAAPTTVPGDPVEIVRVLDGDSLVVTVDGVETEVRLLGINAPEATACHGAEAELALAALVEGRDLDLVADATVDTDQYGRLLRYLYADGELINEALLDAGDAMALHVTHAREDRFLGATEAAYGARRGMWAPEACGPAEAFGAAVTFAEVHYDPPGPDEENPNGEWATIENRDDTGIALDGWTLRDESSTHRYGFGDVVLEAGGSITVFVGCGDDSATDLYWCAGGAVWNNGGDTALLLDSSGNVVARFAYDGD